VSSFFFIARNPAWLLTRLFQNPRFPQLFEILKNGVCYNMRIKSKRLRCSLTALAYHRDASPLSDGNFSKTSFSLWEKSNEKNQKSNRRRAQGLLGI
jgi:hypothetical protein